MTVRGYGATTAVITPAHPLFSNVAFKNGNTTFTPISNLGMARFSDPTFGSGAVRFSENKTLNAAYSGFPAGTTIQIPPLAQGGCGTTCAVPVSCEQQAANLQAVAFLLGIAAAVMGMTGAPAAVISNGVGILGIGGGAAGIASLSPCSAPPPQQIPPSALLANLNPDAAILVSGGPEPPDGGGAGGGGTDQLMYD